MDNFKDLKQQLNDVTSQLDFNPTEMQGQSKGHPKVQDFSKKARRVEVYEKAEEICMDKYPEIQPCLSFDMNADYNSCKALLKTLQKCVTTERDLIMEEKNFHRSGNRNNL